MAKQLGKFLTALHNFSPKTSLPCLTLDKFILQEQIMPHMKSKLSKKTAIKIQEYFDILFKQISNDDFNLTPIHGDLFFNNILFEKNKITGIIDFENVCISDPALDFACIKSFYGDKLCKEILRHYNRSTERNFHKRIKYYQERGAFSGDIVQAFRSCNENN